MLEHHERHFTASAACRNETSNKRTRPSVPSGGNRPPVSQRPQKPPESAPTQPTAPTIMRLCYVCHGSGHFARNCPKLPETKEPETRIAGTLYERFRSTNVIDRGERDERSKRSDRGGARIPPCSMPTAEGETNVTVFSRRECGMC